MGNKVEASEGSVNGKVQNPTQVGSSGELREPVWFVARGRRVPSCFSVWTVSPGGFQPHYDVRGRASCAAQTPLCDLRRLRFQATSICPKLRWHLRDKKLDLNYSVLCDKREVGILRPKIKPQREFWCQHIWSYWFHLERSAAEADFRQRTDQYLKPQIFHVHKANITNKKIQSVPWCNCRISTFLFIGVFLFALF